MNEAPARIRQVRLRGSLRATVIEGLRRCADSPIVLELRDENGHRLALTEARCVTLDAPASDRPRLLVEAEAALLLPVLRECLMPEPVEADSRPAVGTVSARESALIQELWMLGVGRKKLSQAWDVPLSTIDRALRDG